VLVTIGVLAAATGLMFALTLNQDAQFYKHVDEVMASPEPWYGKRLQLHGFVVKGSIYRSRQGLDYTFQVANNGHVVSASYRGIVPDTFKDESEVVITGRLSPEGFQVDEGTGIMAKCPSKYEELKTTPAAAPGAAKQPY
jgi:cytochrome c-type biogenesis protein CcmE